jgi:hypothetical protein
MVGSRASSRDARLEGFNRGKARRAAGGSSCRAENTSRAHNRIKHACRPTNMCKHTHYDLSTDSSTHTHARAHPLRHTHTHTHTHTHKHTLRCKSTHRRPLPLSLPHAHAHVHKYAHTCTHKHTHSPPHIIKRLHQHPHTLCPSPTPGKNPAVHDLALVVSQPTPDAADCAGYCEHRRRAYGGGWGGGGGAERFARRWSH